VSFSKVGMKAAEVRREADCGVMGSIAISMLVRCPFSNATFERATLWLV
jgi:hypothetical protein